MKKTKTESERDLLARNHKRLNKAINDLLTENKTLRKRMDASILEINRLREQIAQKEEEHLISLVHTALHAMITQMDLTSDQVAERAHRAAHALHKKMFSNDN